tara:strand:- start:20 stop:277 length:258 start_codon:yes stop_codon:yes gene_type:complete
MNNDIENFKKKLIYRSQYRGTKEMDKLIGSFVKAIIQKLNDDQLEKLEKFLSTDDNKLYEFYNNEIIEENFNNNEIFSLFKKFKY